MDPRRIRKAGGRQLQFPKAEISRLANRIEEDYNAAISDHEERMRRFQEYYMRWRGRTEETDPQTPNFRVPLTQWHVYSKWAKEMSSLFGDDAQIVVHPTGPNDQRATRKVERFINWRLFHSMKIANQAATFSFRKILFGRAHAYTPWVRDTYWVPLEDGSDAEMVSYEGPGFIPLWPDDLIVPAEDVESVQEFSFCIRKYRATPDQLLRGEGTLYQGIEKHFHDLVTFASHKRTRDVQGELVKREKDLAEGVLYEGNLSAANTLVIHEWYGKWRKLKGRKDAREDNISGREAFESDLVVRFIPEMNLVIGIQDLADLYPAKKERRPLHESSLVKDGSYWCPSFGELLEAIELELSANHNLATKAGRFSVGPVVFYTPASGFDPDTFEMEPLSCVASDNPQGIRVVELKADMNYPVVKEQTMLGYGERVTGQSDMQLGRGSDRPNAPKTARATLALLEEGDVRGSLETRALREDWAEILKHFWALEQMYAPKSLFFRVTEEDAGGLFTVERGGAYLTEDDRFGSYDFNLRFATNVWSREQQKQNQLSLYQLDLQNPLIAQNPRALWLLLDKIHKAFGDDRFSDVIPEPPDMGLPVKPSEEWARLQQGEEVTINPMDNDELHIMDHNKRLEQAAQDENHNPDAYNQMAAHVLEHVSQMQQKKLMAEMVSRLAENLNAGTGGLVNHQPPQTLQNLHTTVGEMIGGQGVAQEAA